MLLPVSRASSHFTHFLLLLPSLQAFSLYFASYSYTACATLLLYDMLLLLPTEINYVWLSRPLRPCLLLFALNRYTPLIDTAIAINWLLHKSTPAQCRRFYITASPFVLGGIFTSQVILMIRTYAIWDRRRAIFWCFIGTGVVCFIPAVVCMAIELKTVHFVVPSSNQPGCLNESSANLMAAVYILMLVTDTIIALITLFKGVEHLRRSTHPFLMVFYASGMLFYICIFTISLANILLPIWVPKSTAFLGCFQRIFHSILCNRVMLLILKQCRRRPTEEFCMDSIELPDTAR
ncbi:uncharacterized protein EV420DRAFT_876850 [Desarmillaria tabescens]|uniref:DUF6533 domain-containing protein n=1 Tax=Armillaria tabescens TaxID=1929756 RepID=A0AA39JS36_ARMTA|nr:uncharacterized protein EV420DRAFT_876850 [Desarmillaria tabescens]KAK0447462.1 hypothetical protein EV420DRAFT_876850 [Desarmillaria tabescens]